jgi:integrase
VLFGAHLRVGEVCGLNRGDYFPEDGTLRVSRQYTDTGRRELRKTKTAQAKTVTLLRPAQEALDAHLRDHPDGRGLDPMFAGERASRVNSASIPKAVGEGMRGDRYRGVPPSCSATRWPDPGGPIWSQSAQDPGTGRSRTRDGSDEVLARLDGAGPS